MPPVIIVRKTYPKFRKRQKHRLWKLKQLEKEGIDDNNFHKKKQNTADRDMDMLIQDIEDDPEIRDQINPYENKDVIKQLEA